MNRSSQEYSQTNEVQEDLGHDSNIQTPHFENNRETVFAQERAKRTKTQPAHLKDFHVDLPSSIDHSRPVSNQDPSTVHPISNFVSYDNFSNSHKSFLAAIESNDEPKNFNQAMQDEKWRDAMKKGDPGP